MNTRLSMLSRIGGRRRFTRTSRSSAASSRFCSLALTSFFVRQAEAMQQSSDRGAVHLDRVFLPQGRGQLLRRRVRPFRHAFADPLPRPGKPAVTTPAPRSGLEGADLPLGLTMWFTNPAETRKHSAASRYECPSSTKSTTRLRRSIGCGLPIACSRTASVMSCGIEARNLEGQTLV